MRLQTKPVMKMRRGQKSQASALKDADDMLIQIWMHVLKNRGILLCRKTALLDAKPSLFPRPYVPVQKYATHDA